MTKSSKINDLKDINYIDKQLKLLALNPFF